MHLRLIALILFSVALSSGSQIVLKRAMMAEGMQSVLKNGSVAEIAIEVASSPLVLAGLAFFGLSAVVWLFVLSRIPLSSAYPFVALGIFVTVLAGSIMFAEPITLAKGIGVGLIVFGIAMVAIAG